MDRLGSLGQMPFQSGKLPGERFFKAYPFKEDSI